MQESKSTSNNVCNSATKKILGAVFLVCGCFIYLLLRSKTLNIYIWCKTLGISHAIDSLRVASQNYHVSDFVRFCLPDGLYCAAYILIMDSIWHEDKRTVKFVFLFLAPIITIGSEILQLWGIVRGTFDIGDLVCYTIPPLVYLGIHHRNYISYNIFKIKHS